MKDKIIQAFNNNDAETLREINKTVPRSEMARMAHKSSWQMLSKFKELGIMTNQKTAYNSKLRGFKRWEG